MGGGSKTHPVHWSPMTLFETREDQVFVSVAEQQHHHDIIHHFRG